ncbi:MAG: hypothetical protein PVF43_08785, partial [Candidatus Eiseniibacteriota bacterium]
MNPGRPASTEPAPSRHRLPDRAPPGARLHEGWVIANHILVSFHVAFISSVLALPAVEILRTEVLRFIFLSPETLVSALFVYISFHTGIALHEMGHFLAAARLNALNESLLESVQAELAKPFRERLPYLLRVFLLAPYGKAPGIKREGLNYYPDAPYNLAVAAAGPRMSRNVAAIVLPPAVLLLATGLGADWMAAIYPGRLLLGIGLVALLDFFQADRGKYAEFRERERRARESSSTVVKESGWFARAATVKQRMLDQCLQEAHHPRLGRVTAPWQFRNCGMGGRHTEKEYPESNISMQEAMFLILGASDFQEAQEMTVRLQNRLKELIEKEEGCRVMGIGLEGGLAPYVDRGTYPLPEVRLWALMKQAIEECGFRPGEDVAIALDPALSELEIAYREENNIPDAVGMYLFWRDKTKIVMDRDGVLDIYMKALQEYEIPILSIEDGFSEDDFEGWKKLLDALGDRIFVIGDDLVTTNDRTIEMAARQGLINAALIKANQIGSLYETLLAMLVALGKGHELVVSHRSKSPNDDMEGQIALAANALGLKCGGGSNTERLIKYQAVATLMRRVPDAGETLALRAGQSAVVGQLAACEEPTNAGVPTVGVEAELRLAEAGIALAFRGATPLGTSAGSGEAIHLVDGMIEMSEYREAVAAHAEFFEEIEPGVMRFRKEAGASRVQATRDEALTDLFRRAQRYGGKGCLNAVDNVHQVIAPYFQGCDLAGLSLREIDRSLLQLELRTARRRGKVDEGASREQTIRILQRKQNLGMNAMLSVSLALGRALAHIRGRQLYELLREEMLEAIEILAGEHDVAIQGSQFDDYVRALRVVNARLEAAGKPLYAELRRITGIYDEAEATLPPDRGGRRGRPAAPDHGTAEPTAPGPTAPEPTAPGPVASGDDAVHAAAASGAASPGQEAVETSLRAGAIAAPSPRDDLHAAPAPGTAGTAVEEAPAEALADEPVIRRRLPVERLDEILTATEREGVVGLAHSLAAAYEGADVRARYRTLRRYQDVRDALVPRIERFEIVNNRLLERGDRTLVPFLIGDLLAIYAVRNAAPGSERAGGARHDDELLALRRMATGAICTDELLRRIVDDAAPGFTSGAVRAIDLETDLFDLDLDVVEPSQVTRIRDMASLLARVNDCVNINEAAYRLRYLAAGLASLSFKAFLGAKNLQPEVSQLVTQLSRFLNGRHAARLRFLARILVRNLSALVMRPNIIDELWNDAIELAEVEVRGSAIVNELRRSSHHALGQRTLRLAEAYLEWLDSGATGDLEALGFAAPAPADVEARHREGPRAIVARIVGNLEKLLGTTETVTRIREWREAYAERLMRCELGNSIRDEVETLIDDGLRARNRWVYQHHLRVIRKKIDDV